MNLTAGNAGAGAFIGTVVKATVRVPKSVKAEHAKWLKKKGTVKEGKDQIMSAGGECHEIAKTC